MNETSSHIESLTVELRNFGAPVLVILCLAAAVYALWYYRSTIPPVSGLLRRFMFALRCIALLLLVIGLSEPVIKIIKTVTIISRAAILLDTSASMDQDWDSSRKSDALETLDRIRTASDNRCIFMEFDNSLRKNDNPVSFSGNGTDIHRAVEEAIQEDNVSAIVLISDGRWNLGHNPAGSDLPPDIPVNTVAVGKQNESADVVLTHISNPSIGYDKTSVPVELFVTSSVELPGPVSIDIREDSSTVVSGTLSIQQGSMNRVRFDIPLDGPGEHRYTAVVTSGIDEPDTNNNRSFAIQVMKSAFRILFIANAPSPDLAFIRRVVEDDDALEGHVFFGRGYSAANNDSFPESFDDFDAFVIMDGGGKILTPERAEMLAGSIAEGKGLWLLGSTPLTDQASALTKALSLQYAVSKKDSLPEVFIELTPSGKSHFITSGSSELGNNSAWEDLPPLTAISTVTFARQNTTVLATAVSPNRTDSQPAIITGKYGKGKTVVVPVSGLWRWHLMMAGVEKNSSFFTSFVVGTLRWLTSGTDISPLMVSSDSRTYLSGQEIAFEARLYDSVFSPVQDAEISIEIDGNSAVKTILTGSVPGVYTGITRGTGPGEHRFRARAYVAGSLFAESEGEFTVDEFSLEMLDTAADHGLLGLLSQKTGGISVTPAGVDSLLERIQPSFFSERREENHYVALNPLLPILAILLLALEWGIRKYRGMI
ncbi:hypothetical protein ACFL47_00790 [Candidatus Latescibacterota bacterium]